MSDIKLAEYYGHDLLGPIFYRFCYKLLLSQSCYSPDDTCILFLSRGGVRLRLFYEHFLSANKIQSMLNYKDFYVSRMAVIKSSLINRDKEDILYLVSEYSGYSLYDMLEAFLSEVEFSRWQCMAHSYNVYERVDFESLNNAIFGDCSSSLYLRGVFEEQSRLYKEYLNSILGEATNVLVVDTGWSGTILNFMMKLDPSRNYLGLYFGRYNYGKAYPVWFRNLVGLEVQAFNFTPKSPITSLFLNRHLVEGICEIRWHSVSGYKHSSNSVVPFEGVSPEENVKPGNNEFQALGVQKYLIAAENGLNFEQIEYAANKAAKKLSRKILYPKSFEVPLLSTYSRSADFGKNIDVSYFVPPIKKPFSIRQKLSQAPKSLWHAGQLALEFGQFSFFFQYYYHWKKRKAAKKRQKLRN